VFVALRRRTGAKLFARCAFDGFYEPEGIGRHRYIWTRNSAQIECHFTDVIKLRYVWLEIANTAPSGTEIMVSWDGQPVISRRLVCGRTTLCGKIPSSVVRKQLTLQIETSTFVPDHVGLGNGDQRALGVALRGIVFGKRWTKYRAGSHFEIPLQQRLQRLARQLRGRRAA
jgi:hypothetical protein